MKANYTHITVVLDRSGSMDTIRTDTIGGFNSFLKTHQEAPGDCTLSLCQFDDKYEDVISFKPVRDAKPLDERTYVPRGYTALLGAIGRAVDETGDKLSQLPESERPEKVIVLIITDGNENSSDGQEWCKVKTKAEVRDRIKHQQDNYKWEFIFIGANQNAFDEAGSMGIPADNALNYTANSQGTQALYASVASSSTKFRSGAVRCCAFSDEDHAAQEAAK